MKIAVIGGGISGLTAAWYLSQPQNHGPDHQVTVFEQNHYAGGHTDTHQLSVKGTPITVDSGFIVFNEQNYPNFTRLIQTLGVEWQSSNMSFSVMDERSSFYYGAEGFQRLFAQKSNLIRPSFYRMLIDIKRFYLHGCQMLEEGVPDITLGEYLAEHQYSQSFIDFHIVPMTCALWSAPTKKAAEFPLYYLLSFMHHHGMLQFQNRPQWQTIKGGSSQYVSALLSQFKGEIRLNQAIQQVKRFPNHVQIFTTTAQETFDAVIFACHSDQALSLLSDPSMQEKQVLGAIPYQCNDVTIHTDTRVLPPNPKAWASWNTRIPLKQEARCTVSYWMNLLQDFSSPDPVIVTLNPECMDIEPIAEQHILATRQYHHPVYTKQTIQAQQQRSSINGQRNTYYCGAYWGWGFHEDGVRSALDVVEQINENINLESHHANTQCAL